MYNTISERPKRLQRELKECRIIDKGLLIEKILPVDYTLDTWVALIRGPQETAYQDGLFELGISLHEDYPYVPPTVVFLTKISHPNIHWETGEVCLDTLQENWSPVWTIKTVCMSIVALLGAPEASSPLNCDSANLIRANDILGYENLVKMYTKTYASPLRKNFMLYDPELES